MKRVIAILGILCAALPGQTPRGRTAIDVSRVVDLTYAFDERTIYWPTAKGFEWHQDA